MNRTLNASLSLSLDTLVVVDAFEPRAVCLFDLTAAGS